jgi:formiminotetrahydrofolate cyclodeaminase
MTDRAAIGDQGIDAWLAALASDAATPGGGAFAALSAAAGAALVAMVGRLTVGKEKYASVRRRMAEIIDECDRERLDLLRLADRDAVAFDAVMAAYKMPRASEEEQTARLHALQEALEGAAEVPLLVARRAVYLMALAQEATVSGNPNAASDGLSGAAALYAATVAAIANVRINAFAFVDQTRRQELVDDCDRLNDRATALLTDCRASFDERVQGS